jgi:hypothetical protein
VKDYASQLEVITKLLIGALSEAEAAEILELSLPEIQRLISAVAGHNGSLVPISVNLDTQRFEFLDIKDTKYSEPFFGDTINRVRCENSQALNFEVNFEDFLCGAERYQRPPDGFLFHVGRCGSTLLANMLSSSGKHLVVKEPDLISDLLAGWLRARNKAARKQMELLVAAAIRYVLGAVGGAGAADVIRYRILKLAAWNVCLAKVILELFPKTPAVFLYRSPLETVASLLFQRPAWFELIECPRSIQASFFPSLCELPEGTEPSPAVLFAHAWRSAAEAALAIPPESLLVMEYRALIDDPQATISRMLSYFHHPIDHSVIGPMAAKRSIYSKDAAQLVYYEPGSKHARPALSCEEADEIRAITAAPWRQLRLRAKQI